MIRLLVELVLLIGSWFGQFSVLTLGGAYLTLVTFKMVIINTVFAHYFVYELNNKVVGYIGFRAIDEHAEVMNFCMDPDYQGQGFGTELFDYSVKYLKSLDVKTMLLEVRKSNKKAQAFYERFGFVKSHVRKNYYKTEDAYVFIKEV